MRRAKLALALLLFLAACGPLGPVPGGRLSGPVAPAAPADWAFTDDIPTVQLETRPASPYSVNVWGVAAGDAFYIPSGGGESRWARHLLQDARVRLRAGDAVYLLRATRVRDPQQITAVLAKLSAKYAFEPEPGQVASAWLFRLESRESP